MRNESISQQEFNALVAENRYMYDFWMLMLSKCYDTNHYWYSKFGKQGVTVTDDWRYDKGAGFRNFLEDMGNRPSRKCTLEQRDRYGNFDKSNLVWMVTKNEMAPKNHFDAQVPSPSGVIL